MRTTTVTLVAAMFAIGVGAPRALPGQAADVIEVPLSQRGGRLAVTATGPSGDSFTFALSTANAVTVLTESAAQRLADAPSVDLAGIAVSLEGAYTVPDDALAGDGVSYDGMIASNTLRDFDLLIDVPAGRLLLREPGRSVTWPGMTLSDAVPIRVLHGVVISIGVEVDGLALPATLDLGTADIVVNEGAGLGAIGASGSVSIGLGTTVLDDRPFRVTDDPMLDRWDPAGDGFAIVGASIARDCALSLSWVHGEVRTCVR